MKSEAIAQAEGRLMRCRKALDAHKSAKSHLEAQEAWVDFLIAAAGFYAKLKAGARGNSASDAWYGRLQNRRKKDPLLSYIHHARDAEEHGIIPNLELASNKVTIISSINKIELIHPNDHSKTLSITPDPNSRATIVVNQRFLLLVPVRDTRYGDVFDPPTSHLGQAIKTPMPGVIGRLAVHYFESVLADAKTLVA